MKTITQFYESYVTYSNDMRGEILHRIYKVEHRKPLDNELAKCRPCKLSVESGYTYYRLYPL